MLFATVQTVYGVRDGVYLTQRLVGIGGACLLVALLILSWRGIREGFRKLTGATTRERDIKRHVFSMIKKSKGIELGELIKFGVVGDIPFARTSGGYFFGDGKSNTLVRSCSSLEAAIQKSWIPASEKPCLFWPTAETSTPEVEPLEKPALQRTASLAGTDQAEVGSLTGGGEIVR